MENKTQKVDHHFAERSLKKWDHQYILVLLIFMHLTMESYAQIKEGIVVIRPVEINDVLINPGMGFTTFQMFNGDNFRPNQDVLNEADLGIYGKNKSSENLNHPPTSIAYFRIQWKFVEPEPGKYRWDFIDGLLDMAHKKGQSLMLRISPYKGHPRDDVPEWYRQMVGPERQFSHEKWVVDPEDPRYTKYFGAMVRALAERYDGHPDLESIDVSIVGFAGEGGGTELLSEKTMKNLLDPYIEGFKKTPMTVLIHGKNANDYITSKTTIGWRQDCLGDLGFWADEQNGWTHMYDYYPQTIIEYGMQEAWKKGPVSFEICGIFDTWDSREGYSNEQVQYIIDQSLKWHISSFNGKSSPVPDKWKPMVDDWLRKMGYRFVLRRFSFPETVRSNGKLNFETWWENKGVAPCYKDYKLAIRLQNKKKSAVFVTEVDIRQWLPGDNLYNDSIFIPSDFKPGEYDVQIAIVDRQSNPKIKLAIAGVDNEGWYSLGKVNIGR
jgi:hypothetical protein